jgi:uncharacterized protein (DUF2147 family)
VTGAAVLAAALLATSGAGDDNSLTGLWKTPVDGGSVVRLERCGEAVCGRVVGSPRLRANPDQRDVRNRNPALRGRSLRGLLVLEVRPLGRGAWGHGWAYDPTDGGVYRGSMKLRDDGSLRLTGCIVAPFCKTQTWTRIE